MERTDSVDSDMGENFSITDLSLIGSSSPELLDEECGSDDEDSFIEISLVPNRDFYPGKMKDFDDDDDNKDADFTEISLSISSLDDSNGSTAMASSSSSSSSPSWTSSSMTLSCSSSMKIREMSNMPEKIPESITMKLLIKLRSMSILRTVFEALTRPQRRTNKTFEGSLRTYAHNLLKLFEKNHEEGDGNRNTGIIRNRTGDKSSKGFEAVMNLDAVRGVLQFMNTSINGRKHRRTQSCPNSTKCSPVHKGYVANEPMSEELYSIDSSIKAAIAHCKNSFGRSSHFRI